VKKLFLIFGLFLWAGLSNAASPIIVKDTRAGAWPSDTVAVTTVTVSSTGLSINGEDALTTVTRVASAEEADVCTTATFAVLAATAQVANTATTSTYATGSGTAYLAYNADNATTASYASTAGTVAHATSADNSTTATHATTSTYATTAGSATSAATATTATSADTCTSATYADTATTATYALNAGGVSALSELSDVGLTSQTSGQLLGWSGTAWTNSAAAPAWFTSAWTAGVTGMVMGDFCVQTTDGTIHRYNGSSWDQVCVIRGTNGTNGTNGTKLICNTDGYAGQLSGDCVTGNTYLDSSIWELYRYSGSAWISQGNIRGATGATGPAGPEGPAGVPLPSYTGNAGKVLKVATNETTATWETVSGGDSLPSQTGNSGKYLTTDGSAASWGELSVPAQPTLSSLTDVALTSQTTGQGITWNGTNWTNSTISGSSASVYYTSGTLADGATTTVIHAADAGPGFKRHAQAFTQESATSLLLHADGTNGSTTFTDERGHTITNSGATISTTQSKFGGSSAYFTGGAYLTAPTGDDFRFSGNFTIDYWVYFSSISGSQTMFDGRVNENAITILQSGGTLYLWSGGGNVITASSAISAATWTHIAVTRSGTDVKLFVNGTQVGSTWTSSATFADGRCWIGSGYDGTYQFNGYIDEFRISKGVARWTSNFTPPTEQYPTPAYNWTPVVPKTNLTQDQYTYEYVSTVKNVDIKYSDLSGDNPTTCTTFTNNTGAAINYLTTVQILP
jgi:hypothetical protein